MRDRLVMVMVALVAALGHGCSRARSQGTDERAPVPQGRASPSGGDRLCGEPASAAGTGAEHAFAIPSGTFTAARHHPRLFWTPERRARARGWIARTHYAPRDDDLEGNALVYAATGDPAAGRAALGLWRRLIAERRLESADGARWYGEAAILAYDWCHDLIPAAERAAFVDYANRVIARGNREPWGGVGHEDSNYYWGYLRNSLAWAIASGPDNPHARELFDDAMVTRFERSFLPFAQGVQKNGVASEGTQYGRYQERYPLIPFLALTAGGRHVFDETDFYRGLVYYNIHATLPGPTIRGGARVADVFPHQDDETWLDGHSGDDAAAGDFMTAMAWLWPDRPVGRHARWWIGAHAARRSPLFEAADPGGAATEVPAIPLDYATPGTGYLWARNAWSPRASVLFAQLASANGQGHQHLDAGSFQLWRRGRWLTRETVAYTEDIAGHRGAGRVPARDTLAHNGLLVGGLGAARAHHDGMPRLVRMESRQAYAYAATDLSPYYRARASSHRDRDDNPHATTVVRELIYLRELETVVVLDRLGGAATKTFLLHFEQAATLQVDGPHVTATTGDQVLRVATLVPARPATRIVDERLAPGDRIGQQRLEVETTGARLLHVLQARDAAAPDAAIALTEDADALVVTIDHPSAGRAVIRFATGPTSAGGSITTPGCAAHPLAAYVQRMTVSDDGPAWGP